MQNIFEKTNKAVIKIGSSLLIKDSAIKVEWLKSLLEDVRLLLDNDIEVVIATSGSVALGRVSFGQGELSIAQKQAASAIGQINLMAYFQDIALNEGFGVAQILLSASDFDDRERYDNLSNVFKELNSKKIVPIINENDSVTVDEIKIGDNDRLAAKVAQICDSDLLVLLSDIDGLYDKNPHLHEDARFIERVDNITKEVEDMASGASSDYGTGGMATKITAAKMASLSGCQTVIANGKILNPVAVLMQENAKYTLFEASEKSLGHRKKFISGFMDAQGEVVVNECAREVLSKGGVSLLPIGIVKVSGDFGAGDLIFVKDGAGNHIASGYANYDAKSARKVLGMKSEEVREILGEVKSELIHADNLIN